MRALTTEETFEAYYRVRDAPFPSSTYEVARELLNNEVSAARVAKAIVRLSDQLLLDDEIAKRYKVWEARRRRRAKHEKYPVG